MEQTILFENVVTYIEVWTGIFLVYFVWMLIYLARFVKKHPTIKQKQPAKDPETQELLRQYNNKMLFSLCMAFVWAAGVMLIACNFKISGGNVLLIIILLVMMVFPLMGIKRKKK